MGSMESGNIIARSQALPMLAPQARTEAFHELVNSSQRTLHALAYRILGDWNETEEVVQESVFKAIRSWPSFRGECKPSTWLGQITINEARMRLRKERRHLFRSLEASAQNSDGEYVPLAIEDRRPTPSQQFERRELWHLLMKALRNLPPKYGLVLFLRDVEAFSINETAAILKISTANVKTIHLRARQKMRKQLASTPYWRRAS